MYNAMCKPDQKLPETLAMSDLLQLPLKLTG